MFGSDITDLDNTGSESSVLMCFVLRQLLLTCPPSTGPGGVVTDTRASLFGRSETGEHLILKNHVFIICGFSHGQTLFISYFLLSKCKQKKKHAACNDLMVRICIG